MAVSRAYVPVFSDGGRKGRLYVHVGIPLDQRDEIWGDPRPAQLDDLIAAVKSLSPEMQAYVATNLGLVPEVVGERLEAAESVIDALADARLAVTRFAEYRERFPEKRQEG